MLEPTKENIEKEFVNNCDSILFGTYVEDSKSHTVMSFIQSTKSGKKQVPTDLGYKFNILLFNRMQPEEKDIDLFSAILGDPKGYVERVGKLGYSGMLLKQKTFSKNTSMIELIKKQLFLYGFVEKLANKVLKAMVK